MVSSAPSKYILLAFDLGGIPVGAQIVSAQLSLYCVTAPAAMHENDVLRIKEPWDPDTVAFPLEVDYESQFDMDSGNLGRRLEGEARKLVQSWVNGAPNYGIGLATQSGSIVEFQSVEAADQTPFLRIRYYF